MVKWDAAGRERWCVGRHACQPPLAMPVTGIRDVYVVNSTEHGWHFVSLQDFTFD